MRLHRWVHEVGIAHLVYERDGLHAMTTCGRYVAHGRFESATMPFVDGKCVACLAELRARSCESATADPEPEPAAGAVARTIKRHKPRKRAGGTR